MTSHEILVGVILVVVAIVVIAWLELKYMRRSMRARRGRATRGLEELPDTAHNALVTTRAIVAALERGGVHSEEADGLLREAQMAYGRRNYRVVIDLTSKAKERLTALKAGHAAMGDLAKLDAMPSGGDETTTKELLQRDFPTNLTQAKFTIDLVASAVEAGRASGRDVGQAEALLAQARVRFDGQDYTGALASARQAQRSAEAGPIPGLVVEASGSASVTMSPDCPACGSPIAADDAFCRKCGTRLRA
ncbi:MAG: zinc ribbon domain-containing protein [Methanobacteriota archaeon]